MTDRETAFRICQQTRCLLESAYEGERDESQHDGLPRHDDALGTTDLPDVIKACLSFVGRGNYRLDLIILYFLPPVSSLTEVDLVFIIYKPTHFFLFLFFAWFLAPPPPPPNPAADPDPRLISGKSCIVSNCRSAVARSSGLWLTSTGS
jgi:hypothetical protein